MAKLCCILLSIFVMVKGTDTYLQGPCVRKDIVLECIGDFPVILADNISEVYVRDYSKKTIDGSVFKDVRWGNITMLYIEVNDHSQMKEIGDFTFNKLHKLTSLGISGSDLETFGENVFSGLDDLQTLDLSGCVSLELDSLVKALINETIAPSISTLLLNNVGSRYMNYLHIGRGFVEMLILKNITKLSLAFTNLYIKPDLLTKDDILPMVDVNLSYTNSYVKVKSGVELGLSILRNIRVIDMSGSEYRYSPEHTKGQVYYKECGANEYRIPFFTRMIKVYASKLVVNSHLFSHNYIFNATNCPINLQTIRLRSSQISRANATVFWPMDAPMLDVDLSDNAMRYFSIRGHLPVIKVNLSRNRLYLTEKLPEFADSFATFPLLQELILDHNRLRTLPRDIFLHNPRLMSVHLQGNRLTTLSFDVIHLHNMQLINLKENEIDYISDRDLFLIDNLQTSQLALNRSLTIKVDIRHNKIECSCKNIELIRWVWRKYKQYADHIYNISCNAYGQESIKIDHRAIRRVEFLCKRTLIIVTSSSIFVAVLVTTAFAVFVWRIRARRREVGLFIERFKEKKTKERFLALVSHSKADSAIVFTSIRPSLEEALRKLVPVDIDLLCLGDVHFRPGMAIVDEIHKSVLESCVAIFVISRAFCESGYCQCEMKEAYAQNKPIILMFLEEIDGQIMSPLMQSVFSKYARVKVVREGVDVTITPSWDHLTQSIVTLAVKTVSPGSLSSCLVSICNRDYLLVPQD